MVNNSIIQNVSVVGNIKELFDTQNTNCKPNLALLRFSISHNCFCGLYDSILCVSFK